ncbi:MAG: lipid-A-disaccharide synthase [Acidobacteria bacterium]|nr:lipid-A-disaccharide synthase [Acidobacteriota bacterium]
MKLAVITGEASGDLHASEVVRHLRELDPELRAFGFGGDRLRAQGVELLHDIRELGIVGLFNVIRHIPMFKRVFREIVERIEAERPDAVLLVDYPDFNLRLAKACRARGLKIAYYISPQLWAWRKGRIHEIRKNIDEMIVVFPFEEKLYRDHGVSVTYVGHPLLEQLENVRRLDRPAPRPGELLRVALLPGSRRHEIDTLLPSMLDAVEVLGASRPVEAFVVQAPTIDRSHLEKFVASSNVPVAIRSGLDRRAIVDADVAICASGTATLETGIIGVPMVVVYKLTALSYALARRLVKLPNFALVNIVAGERIVPELLQDEVCGPEIAAAVSALCEPETHAATRLRLSALREKLGGAGASRRAAEKIVTLMRR